MLRQGSHALALGKQSALSSDYGKIGVCRTRVRKDVQQTRIFTLVKLAHSVAREYALMHNFLD
jgi:hypothetical protein